MLPAKLIAGSLFRTQPYRYRSGGAAGEPADATAALQFSATQTMSERGA
jgi:hypothetical protein